MKFAMLPLVAALAFVLIPNAAGSVVTVDQTPVTRVVELLKALSTQVEGELKKEQELFKAYQCWANTVISEKTASNEKSAARVDSLESYIADIEAGRVEFTTERVDLEKQISDIRSDLEIAEAQRKKELADYNAAKEELAGGIGALEDAIKVLKDATGYGPPDTSFLSVQQRSATSESLNHAVDITSRVLSRGDARFLQRLLDGEVPTWDWKKLNRKATFKSKYKARSGKIQDVLNALLFQFQSGLKDADYQEAQAVKKYEELKKAKSEMLDKAIDALGKMEEEGFAAGLTKDGAKAEIKKLKEQIKNDEGFIEDTKKALEDKKAEHKVRNGLRMGEIEAINKAIAILHNDDARDLFKRSFKSQGFSFLQVAGSGSKKRDAAVSVLKASRDKRVKALMMKIASDTTGHFDAVIKAIDKMLTTLEDEEADDLKNKETCEKDRADDTREAITHSRAMDEHTETIVRLTSEIEELEAEIKEKEEEIKDIEKEMEDATILRGKERKEWVKTNKDDEEAHKIVAQAAEVLSTFYKDNFGLLQQPLSRAGDAPPPPPPTWTEPYAGKKGEQSGIVAILEMVEEDIKKDQATAKAAEDAAQKKYDDFIIKCDTQIGDLKSDISTLEGDVATKKGEVSTNKGDRTDKHKELKAVLKKIADAESGCDYITINYETRAKNRALEKDGLDKAKAILKNARFEDPKDPNREYKPGDAF